MNEEIYQPKHRRPWLFEALEEASKALEELPEWARPIVNWPEDDE